METKPKKTIAPRVDMPCQPADVRAHNFDEVATGYTKEMAMQEASRCLQCKKPLCMKGCPVEVPIRDFIAEVARGNFDAAYRIIKTTNSLPAVCGRVCPQEHQCEGKCILNAKGQPIAIGRLERFVADTYIATSACEQVTGTNSCAMPVKGKKVACIGSGPSSLTCAGVCAANGLKVDVFEALHEPGGVLIYGIPSFRLPKNVVATEVDGLRRSGVDFHLNSVVGRTFTVDELRKEYDAVFIGVGAGLPVFLGVPGENLVGVFSANEYLTRVNLGRAYAFPEQDTPAYLGTPLHDKWIHQQLYRCLLRNHVGIYDNGSHDIRRCRMLPPRTALLAFAHPMDRRSGNRILHHRPAAFACRRTDQGVCCRGNRTYQDKTASPAFHFGYTAASLVDINFIVSSHCRKALVYFLCIS